MAANALLKAKQLGLTPPEVTVLASIVEEETNATAEKDDIASVYLNRLESGMLLQADPTIKYAVGDFTLRRVWGIHTRYQSPYNTYVTKGLPPGPICTPSTTTIDAVLAAPETPFFYFCADPERPGYHAFARNMAEHSLNVARYRLYQKRHNVR